MALLGKWFARFLSKEEKTWKDVIVEFHGSNGGFGDMRTQRKKGVWAVILSCCSKLQEVGLDYINSFKKTITNGSQSLFWKDPAVGGGYKLKDLFPRLYALENQKDAKFRERWTFVCGKWQGSWNWRAVIRGRSLEEFNEMMKLMNGSPFKTTGNDVWSWEWDKNGIFSVSLLTKRIQSKMFDRNMQVSSNAWNPLIPSKINVFFWRLVNNGLALKVNLTKRGIHLESDLCMLCNNNVEDLEHCFFKCPKSDSIWRKVWAWWDMKSPIPESIQMILTNSVLSGLDKRRCKIFKAVCLITLWAIWGWRNNVFHAKDDEDRSRLLLDDIFSRVQSLSKFWISNRKGSFMMSLETWIKKPYSDVGFLHEAANLSNNLVST